jgi:hypothetical protein
MVHKRPLQGSSRLASMGNMRSTLCARTWAIQSNDLSVLYQLELGRPWSAVRFLLGRAQS